MDEEDVTATVLSRRAFIQGVMAASAAATIVGLPVDAASELRHTDALTTGQLEQLASVMNRLVPAAADMPAAGDLGTPAFVNRALVVAPHLREPIVAILTALPPGPALAGMPDAEAVDLLQRVEHEHGDEFDLLVQATFAGYYTHPRILEMLHWVDPDVDVHRLGPFDVSLLADVVQRGPIYRNI